MTIYIKLNGGTFNGGKIEGNGEYHEENNNGEGKVKKGNFTKGKLNDPDGIYITYNNISFISYRGTFIDDMMNGHIQVIEYLDDSPETPEEAVIEGNGEYKANGRRHIYNSDNDIELDVRKKSTIYDNNIFVGTVSDSASAVKLQVAQKDFNEKKMFSDFTILE